MQGFHSLVEVLLKHGFPTNRRSMWLAVKARRPDLVKLLFDHGALVDAVSFSTVLSFTNLHTIDQFIERGADTVTGFLIAPRFFCRIYKTYIARFPEWELQRDVALRRAAGEGKLQAVCLLNWLGADARRPVPEKEGEDEELWDTALRAAIWSGQLKIVEQFKVCRDRDDVDELLLNACTFGNIDAIRYLVNLGADLNKIQEGGTCPASELIHSFSR